ncbi:hypothetical protein [Flagellimonas allohymeniacidonis]|uniref:Lipoprotein n=1 Tax=Flagellimonas allohymeniacidonis TaxID=2517819 RepID=A0A4Q8QJK5_9FLAO|nr:hypothetical protein [Allomuricauda hymeniacidonis]TAI48416.1 hypothetical protein EW142_01010 [Allomuricauda hymeniacidonis]
MKLKRFFLLLVLGLSVGCGPVLVSHRLADPPPPWFYPNRLEAVRYVYFPDHFIYYDLSLRSYFYLDNGVWISVKVLPSRFRTIDLRRSKSVRIRNYYGDNIDRYHREQQSNRGRSNKNLRRSNQ